MLKLKKVNWMTFEGKHGFSSIATIGHFQLQACSGELVNEKGFFFAVNNFSSNCIYKSLIDAQNAAEEFVLNDLKELLIYE